MRAQKYIHQFDLWICNAARPKSVAGYSHYVFVEASPSCAGTEKAGFIFINFVIAKSETKVR